MADDSLTWQPNEDSNSVQMIVQHLWGNMMSRWTDFLTTDGEKPWRKRDEEFEQAPMLRAEMMEKWEEGWQCLLNTLNSLNEDDLEKIIYIRNDGHTALEAINRQIAHYSYHVGQIVYIAKICNKSGWNSLSIPRNKSNEYNAAKFSQEKDTRHFTDEWLDKK